MWLWLMEMPSIKWEVDLVAGVKKYFEVSCKKQQRDSF